MPRDTLRKAVAMVIALFGGAAWVLQFSPRVHFDPYPWLPQYLLLAAGSVITYWLMRLTACGLTEISKDQLVRRLAVVSAAVVTWSNAAFLARRLDIEVDGLFAIATVIWFGTFFVLFYLFVSFTVDRVKFSNNGPQPSRSSEPSAGSGRHPFPPSSDA
jgi:hypothetical protein